LKGKGKFHLVTAHEGPEGEQRYSFTLYLTAKKETWYPLVAGWPQGSASMGKENLIPTGFDSWTAQPIASCHPGPPLKC